MKGAMRPLAISAPCKRPNSPPNTSATTGPCPPSLLPRRVKSGARGLDEVADSMGQQFLFCKEFDGHLRDEASPAHHDNAMGEADELHELRRNDNDCTPLRRQAG